MDGVVKKIRSVQNDKELQALHQYLVKNEAALVHYESQLGWAIQ